MAKFVQIARACLAAGAFSLALSGSALADIACTPDWHAEAAKTAELGLQLLHSPSASDRVRLWRLIELGEEAPNGRSGEDGLGEWGGGWADERRASELLTSEANARGVGWPTFYQRYPGASLNLTFAAKLFEERRLLLGDDHPYLKLWLENQRAVFTRFSPDLVDASRQFTGLAAELAADDYQYQLAALVFYAQSYTDAIDRFRAIAMQPNSRYRSIAAYMVARSLALAGRTDEALTEISSIESNPQLSDVHAITRQIVGVIAWNGWARRNPIPVSQEVTRRLLKSNTQAMRLPLAELESDSSKRNQYWQAVTDLEIFLKSDGSRSWMGNQFEDDWWLDQSRAEQFGYWAHAVARVAAEDDLIDWLEATEQVRVLASGPWLAYWSTRASSLAFKEASDHVTKRAEETGRLVWLIADAMRLSSSRRISRAIHDIESKMPACEASRGELLVLGALRYHVARLGLVSRERYYRYFARLLDIEQVQKLEDGARREAARVVLPLLGSEPNSAVPKTDEAELNLLLSASLNEFMAVATEYYGEDGKIAVINMLPMRILLTLAGDEKLSQSLRATLVRAAWTRAYLLKDEALLEPATELLAELNPGLRQMVDRYRGAWTERGRKGAALALLVRTPGMQPIIPNRSDTYYGYSRSTNTPVESGVWSWYLSPAESAKESIGIFWADDFNHNDGNWWCRPDIVRLQAKLERDFYDKPLALAYDDRWYSYYDPLAHIAYKTSLLQVLSDRRRDFLIAHPVLKLIDWEELGRLSKIPAAPEYLATEVADWVKSASWLDRWMYGEDMAEALALAVRATRFGCHRDGSNRRWSYAAFDLLHDLFPDSVAAGHTRYWYD